MKMLQGALNYFDPLFNWALVLLMGAAVLGSWIIHQHQDARLRDGCAPGQMVRR